MRQRNLANLPEFFDKDCKNARISPEAPNYDDAGNPYLS